MRLLIYGVPSKGRDPLFFHLSLISESKSESWFAENQQNSHWYRPQEVIYIGCEHSRTQRPTKLFVLVGKIFPNEQFPMATKVMQCSRLLALSPSGESWSSGSLLGDVLPVWFCLFVNWNWSGFSSILSLTFSEPDVKNLIFLQL